MKNLGNESQSNAYATLQAELHRLNAAYYSVKTGNMAHGDGAVAEVRKRIADIESKMSKYCRVTYRLFESKWSHRYTEHLATLMEVVRPSFAALQRSAAGGASLKERQSSKEAKDLTGYGVYAACLFSGPYAALLVRGKQGYLHNDIRAAMHGSLNSADFRPDTSGLICSMGGKNYFISDGTCENIWPSDRLHEISSSQNSGGSRIHIHTPVIDVDNMMVDSSRPMFLSDTPLKTLSRRDFANLDTSQVLTTDCTLVLGQDFLNDGGVNLQVKQYK